MELIDATRKGDLARTEELLRRGANPNAVDVLDRSTPLQAAALRGHLALAQLLVRYGAQINSVAGDAPENALSVAAVAGHVDLVEWLLQAGAKVPPGAAGDVLIDEVQQQGDNRIAAMLLQAHQRG